MGSTARSLVLPHQLSLPRESLELTRFWLGWVWLRHQIVVSDFLKLTLGDAKGTSVPRGHRSQQAPSCLRAKDSACRCFTSPLQLCREKNMVNRFPTFTEQRNLFLLLVCSVLLLLLLLLLSRWVGGFSWKRKLASQLGPHCHLLALCFFYIKEHYGDSQAASTDESERINSIDSNLLTLNVWSNLESFIEWKIQHYFSVAIQGYTPVTKISSQGHFENSFNNNFNSFMCTRHLLTWRSIFSTLCHVILVKELSFIWNLFILTYTTRDNKTVFLLNTSGIWNHQ